MSSRMFHNVILQLKEASDRYIGVLDAEGNVICCSNTTIVGEKWPEAVLSVDVTGNNVTVFDKKSFKPILGWNGAVDYVVFVEGDDRTSKSICLMSHVALSGTKA